MVDLYKDIDWDEYIESVDYDMFEFTKELKSQCASYQNTDDFKKADVKKPELNTSFSNFLLCKYLMSLDLPLKALIGFYVEFTHL